MATQSRSRDDTWILFFYSSLDMSLKYSKTQLALLFLIRFLCMFKCGPVDRSIRMKQQVTVKSLLVGYFVLLVTARQINFQCQNKLAFAQNARTGIEELQKSYDPSNGLYGNLWWNSANIVTMLADFQEYFPAFVNDITSTVFNTTLTMAPRSNNNNGFLNAYYDDELWWALAWIKVYDVTHDVKYLDTASSIFEDAKASWGTSPCGGLWRVTHF